jgi:4-hydroxybenzoate polyprenyltransferase
MSISTAAPIQFRFPVTQIRLCVMESRPVVQLIFTLRFVVAFALTYPGHLSVPAWRPALALLTWLLATASAYLFDGVMDVAEDRLNGSRRPIARGALSPSFALAASIVWAVLSLVGAAILGGLHLLLVPLVLGLGYAYCGPGLRLKRWSSTAGATVLIAGMLTFVAGGAAGGARPTSATLLVFALAMSSLMGLVGAVAKDFSDVVGDTLAGRRTLAVVRGIRPAARRLSANAFLVATAFAIAALVVDELLLWPAAVVVAGAAAVTLACRPRSAAAHPRRPYRAFMVTQYLAHAAVLVVALAQP